MFYKWLNLSSNFGKLQLIISLLTVLIAVSYMVNMGISVDFVTRFVCFLVRIALIKAKNFWNWSYVDKSGCLFMNPYYRRLSRMSSVNCYSCQDVHKIGEYNRLNEAQLENHLINQIPLIIGEHDESINDLLEWKAFHNHNFDDIIEKYSQLNDFDVCKIACNLIRCNNWSSLFKLRKQIDSWFIHWENCSKKSKKFVRQFYGKLNIIPTYVDLTLSSWILLSKNYSGLHYKRIAIDYRANLAIFVQIKGKNLIKLDPVNDCKQLGCTSHQIALKKSEILIFNTDLWKLNYRPIASSVNYAVILTGVHDSLI